MLDNTDITTTATCDIILPLEILQTILTVFEDYTEHPVCLLVTCKSMLQFKNNYLMTLGCDFESTMFMTYLLKKTNKSDADVLCNVILKLDRIRTYWIKPSDNNKLTSVKCRVDQFRNYIFQQFPSSEGMIPRDLTSQEVFHMMILIYSFDSVIGTSSETLSQCLALISAMAVTLINGKTSSGVIKCIIVAKHTNVVAKLTNVAPQIGSVVTDITNMYNGLLSSDVRWEFDKFEIREQNNKKTHVIHFLRQQS